MYSFDIFQTLNVMNQIQITHSSINTYDTCFVNFRIEIAKSYISKEIAQH